MTTTALGLLFDHESAEFDSPARVYRYTLNRRIGWEEHSARRVCWIMLNPSTADEIQNDPTIRRCISFSKSWGFEMLEVVNLFAYRATKPKEMLAADDPVGPLNDQRIGEAMERADRVIAAWGAHGRHFDRGKQVREIARNLGVELYALGLTSAGEPRHPLYLRGDVKPTRLNA